MADLLIERDERVLLLTLNRPETLNALTAELFLAVRDAVAEAARDDKVGCVVITGAGRGFCSGGDRKAKAADIAREATLPVEERKRPQTFEGTVAEVRRWAEGPEILHDMAKPSIAMINGACAGAGLSLAGACDLRFAGRAASFSSVFAGVGVSGDMGGSWLWTRILGAAKVRELYLLADKMGAEEALAFGLVSRVIDDAALREETLKVAHRLAARPPHVARYIKENLNAAEDVGLSRLLDIETRNMLLSGRSWLQDEPRVITPKDPPKDEPR